MSLASCVLCGGDHLYIHLHFFTDAQAHMLDAVRRTPIYAFIVASLAVACMRVQSVKMRGLFFLFCLWAPRACVPVRFSLLARIAAYRIYIL